MDVTELLDRVPIWGVFAASLLITFLSMEIGFLLGRRRRRRLIAEERIHAGPLAPAALGLLAFLLAVTFASVSSRLNDLKQVGLDEANAIGTAYIRADLLPAADGAEARKLLRDYVTLRIEAVDSASEQNINQAIIESELIQSELWSKATAIAIRQPTPISALYVQSLNEVIDMHEKRITHTLHYRLPGLIWVVLYSLAILAMSIGGYDTGVSGSRRVTGITLPTALAFAVVLMLVIAIDRPHQHLSRVTYASLLDLQEEMHSDVQPER